MRRILMLLLVLILLGAMFALVAMLDDMSNNISDCDIQLPSTNMADEQVSIPIEESNIEAEIIEPEVEIEEPEVEEPRWWTDWDLDILAAVLQYECGGNECTDRFQQLVGQVVVNRKNSHEFPNTIYDVITQTVPCIQYHNYQTIIDNAGNRDIVSQRCYDNALAVLNGEVDCPDNIVWQANFIQGSGIYETIYTSYSVSYFCYR